MTPYGVDRDNIVAGIDEQARDRRRTRTLRTVKTLMDMAVVLAAFALIVLVLNSLIGWLAPIPAPSPSPWTPIQLPLLEPLD